MPFNSTITSALATNILQPVVTSEPMSTTIRSSPAITSAIIAAATQAQPVNSTYRPLSPAVTDALVAAAAPMTPITEVFNGSRIADFLAGAQQPIVSPYSPPGGDGLSPREQIIAAMDPKAAAILKKVGEQRVKDAKAQLVPYRDKLRWGYLPAMRAKMMEAYRMGKPMPGVMAVLNGTPTGDLQFPFELNLKNALLAGGAIWLAWKLLKK